MTAVGFLMTGASVACDKGPMQKTGERIDRATEQDKVIGRGPVEKAGKSIDQAVKELTK
jgi:hypothetical protein